MSRGLYFYDQYNRVSHLGGIQRFKRHGDDLNQALHHVRIAVAADSDQTGKAQPITPTMTDVSSPSPTRQPQQFGRQTNDHLLKTIQRKFKSSFVPDLLFKELDKAFQRYDDPNSAKGSSSNTSKAPSSNRNKSGVGHDDSQDQDVDQVLVEEVEDEHELIAKNINRPRISLPASLILSLHSTWADLIEDVHYKFPVWRTKSGEDDYKRSIERKRLEKINAEKQRVLSNSKQGLAPRVSSRASVSSLKNLSTYRRQTLTTAASQLRPQRSTSRVSFSAVADPNRLIKSLPQGSSESMIDPAKAGLHVEFKFSSQIDPVREHSANSPSQPKGATFDVRQSTVISNEDEIRFLQNKCKSLLADMKERIDNLEKGLERDKPHVKLTKLWFYGDNQHIRARTNLLTLNEAAKREKTKFVFAVLRGQIPEKYQINVEIPPNKRKLLLEFDNGSGQIYYPSGRLAVLRLSSAEPEILFFDDKEPFENAFLGFVRSDVGAVLMEPSSYPRLINNDRFEHFFLCSHRNGEIEKEVQWHRHPVERESALSNASDANSLEEDILPPLFENTIQFQINAAMQLEFSPAKSIRFAYSSDQEEIHFQLASTQGASYPTSILKKHPPKSKYSSHSSSSNEISAKQQVHIERLLDGQINQKELPMFKDLLALRKRIRSICNLWLKACRSTLGVLDIESYCLPGMPSSSRSTHLVSAIKRTPFMTNLNRSKSAKPSRHVTISSKHQLINGEFLQASEKEIILRTMSAKKAPPDLLETSISQFVSHSETARSMQQRMEVKKSSSPLNLPAIQTDGRRSAREDPDVPFVCASLMRQRLIRDGRPTMAYETCSCRVDRLSVIHDLEFDQFIAKTNQINPRQLVLIGIINSNLHQIPIEDEEEQELDVQQSKELFDILEKFHADRNFGRSPICLCRLSTNDDYRCLVYDLADATKQSSLAGPLLVRRHHVQPGFLLIYQHGQLIFGDSIFNGYGRNLHDLQKQLLTIQQHQTPLPDQFKFVADHRQTNKTLLKSI